MRIQKKRRMEKIQTTVVEKEDLEQMEVEREQETRVENLELQLRGSEMYQDGRIWEHHDGGDLHSAMYTFNHEPNDPIPCKCYKRDPVHNEVLCVQALYNY